MTTHDTRVLFFVPEWPALESGVLASQVFAVAGFRARKGFDCLFVGAERSEEQAHRAEAFIEQRYSIQAKVFDLFPSRPNALSLAATTYNTFARLRSFARTFAPTHVYTRSCIASIFGRRLANDSGAVSIYDLRALLASEVALSRQRGTIAVRLINFIEEREMKRAERLATVSKRLNVQIQRQVSRTCTAVIPSCYDPQRFYLEAGAREQIRDEFRVTGEEKLLCYSGGTAPWQRVSDILTLFDQLSRRRDDVRFMILTPDAGHLRSSIASLTHPSRFHLKNCSHDDVRRHLSACDAGVIMRHDTMVNNVASPIKVAEYLACGLPVIMTQGIGDYSEDLVRERVGLLLDERKDLPEQVIRFIFNPDFDGIRDRASRYALGHLTLDANWRQYQDLYRPRGA